MKLAFADGLMVGVADDQLKINTFPKFGLTDRSRSRHDRNTIAIQSQPIKQQASITVAGQR